MDLLAVTKQYTSYYVEWVYDASGRCFHNLFYEKINFFLEIKIEKNEEEEEDEEPSPNIKEEDEELDSGNIADSEFFDFDATPQVWFYSSFTVLFTFFS
jgi:hypothetical protein